MASIYLDYNATTPVAPEVVVAMLPFLREHFGNPSSAHTYADAPRRAMATAREDTAHLIGARATEIVFTGSATEANNLAILGVARAWGHARRHVVISAIEHPAVSEPARRLQELGGS
ncbi:aminotransferase class V, partial [mine drainage metagenome]